MRRFLIPFAVLPLLSLPAFAQTEQPSPTPAEATPATSPSSGSILLEMNNATDTPAGACRLTVVITNRLPQALKQAAWQVAIFDKEGLVQSLPVLDFGAMIAGKTKVAMFEIPDRSCGQIGRIIVNDVAQCQAEDGTDLRDTCLSDLTTQSRGDIELSL